MKRISSTALAMGLSASLLAGCSGESTPPYHAETQAPVVSCANKTRMVIVGSYMVRTAEPHAFQPVNPTEAQNAINAAVHEGVNLQANGIRIIGWTAMAVSHDREDLLKRDTPANVAMWEVIETTQAQWKEGLLKQGAKLDDNNTIDTYADFSVPSPLDMGTVRLELLKPAC